MAILFTIETPLKIAVRTTQSYWNYVVQVKHKLMTGKEEMVKEILRDPEEIRRSSIDSSVFLYYKRFDKLYCVVAKHEDGEGFLITAYPTDKVKEGEIIWTKS